MTSKDDELFDSFLFDDPQLSGWVAKRIVEDQSLRDTLEQYLRFCELISSCLAVLASTKKTANCLNDHQLAEFPHLQVGQPEMHEIEQHVSACHYCRVRIWLKAVLPEYRSEEKGIPKAVVARYQTLVKAAQKPRVQNEEGGKNGDFC